MATKTLEKLPLHKQILVAMDGRRNNWLVEKTGIDAATISRIINGLPPTASQLEKINIALSTDFTLNG
jgi:DNA-binding Xre family transcriptional regulator